MRKRQIIAITLWIAGLLLGETVERPNILWLTCEDNNVSWIGCYGNPHAETPNIDRLAENTIVIHNSDHGGVLPRRKQPLYL